MRAEAVTTRYTEALFRLAQRKGQLDEVGRDVERIAREVASPAVAAHLFDVRIDVEQRRATLAPLFAELSPLTRNFVQLVFDKRREEVLAGLGAAWHRRALEERRAAEGVVESARPLAAEDVQRLEQALGARLGLDVRLTNAVDARLLAGVRVIVENRMLDCSAQGRLEGLRQRLLEVPLMRTTARAS